MKDLVGTVLKMNIQEIENYNFPLDEPFGLEINYDGAKFWFIMKFSSNNKNLLCFGSGG